MRIVGLGVDVVEIARIDGFLRNPTRNWAAGIFSAAERQHADEPPHDARYYAGRFAGKEAVGKALGTGLADDVTVHTIEIIRLPSGAPSVNVIGGAKEVADGLGVTDWFISISYSGGLAIAVVIAVGG